jgi:hypothetical protein
MRTTTTCPLLHEMDDAHQVETALIAGSLTKDDRTHGCILATTGGVILRAECKVHSKQQQHQQPRHHTNGPTSTASDKSRIICAIRLLGMPLSAADRIILRCLFASSSSRMRNLQQQTATPAATTSSGERTFLESPHAYHATCHHGRSE